MKKFLFYLFVIAILLIVGIYLFRSQNYPVASVNGSLILAQDFENSFEAGRNFYEKEVLLNSGNTDAVAEDEFLQELRRATLDASIKSELSRQLLYELLGQEEADRLVAERVAQVESERDESTDQAVTGVFGTDWGTFKQLVIIPQARIELLQSEVENRGLFYQSWIKAEFEKAGVDVLVPGFVWENGNVELQ